MSQSHLIDGTIDPKHGNFIRVVAKGSDIEKVLGDFCRMARFVASHTEGEIKKKNEEDSSFFKETT